MAGNSTAGLVAYFGALEDPRVDRTKRHKLMDIIIIAICGVICGADSWVGIERFGRAKRSWFQRFLDLDNGIPSHDTFGRVFAALDPEQFQACFMGWHRAWPSNYRGKWSPWMARCCVLLRTRHRASQHCTW